MKRFCYQPLLIAAALMVALPVGLAAAEKVAKPDTGGKPSARGPVPHALAAVPCGKRTDVVKMLRDNFGETPIGHGMADTGAVAEVFLSAKGTWTIVATSPDGMACMVGAGQSWQPVVAHDDTI